MAQERHRGRKKAANQMALEERRGGVLTRSQLVSVREHTTASSTALATGVGAVFLCPAREPRSGSTARRHLPQGKVHVPVILHFCDIYVTTTSEPGGLMGGAWGCSDA